MAYFVEIFNNKKECNDFLRIYGEKITVLNIEYKVVIGELKVHERIFVYWRVKRWYDWLR